MHCLLRQGYLQAISACHTPGPPSLPPGVASLLQHDFFCANLLFHACCCPAVSPEARQFLSKTASEATPFASPSANMSDPAVRMAALTQARQWYRQLNEPLHAAAVQQHLESTTNNTFGNVSVVIGVPKGGVAQSPRNTKVLLYMHGERKVLAYTRGCSACPVHLFDIHLVKCMLG